MRILQCNNQKEAADLMRDIAVDPYGIVIMAPKAIERLVRISALSCIEANILKQEMLSLGGDAAVARGALTGKIKKTDCLLVGTIAQYTRLFEKLKKQPFGLDKLSCELSGLIMNYQKDIFIIEAAGFKLKAGPAKTLIMGIVNMTPDSFSGDGLYPGTAVSSQPFIPTFKNRGFQAVNEVGIPPKRGRITGISGFSQEGFIERSIDYAQCMIKDGADIIDIGGESTRPGSAKISVKEELSRVIPLIKVLAKRIKAPISIDTYKAEVARQALDNGASIVNDISALGLDSRMPEVVKKYKAAVILMHKKGTPRSMQNNPSYVSLFDEINAYFYKAVNRAQDAGINANSIIIDPGIGFGKTLEHNLAILKNLAEFKAIGKPILVGPSRKSFIGKILQKEPQDRLSGTLSACVLAVKNGAAILRVHDVQAIKEAVKVANAVQNSGI